MSEEEIKSMFDSIPKVANNNCISAYGSVNIDDLKNAMERLNKVPDYNDLLQENKKLKEDYEQEYSKNIQAIKYIKGGCKGHDYYEYDYILEILEGNK